GGGLRPSTPRCGLSGRRGFTREGLRPSSYLPRPIRLPLTFATAEARARGVVWVAAAEGLREIRRGSGAPSWSEPGTASEPQTGGRGAKPPAAQRRAKKAKQSHTPRARWACQISERIAYAS